MNNNNSYCYYIYLDSIANSLIVQKKYTDATKIYSKLDSLGNLSLDNTCKYSYAYYKLNFREIAINIIKNADFFSFINCRIDTLNNINYLSLMDTSSYLNWIRKDTASYNQLKKHVYIKVDSFYNTIDTKIINQIRTGNYIHKEIRSDISIQRFHPNKSFNEILIDSDSSYATYLKWLIDIDNLDSVAKYYPFAKTLVLSNFYNADYYLKAFNQIQTPPLQIIEMIYELNRIKHEMINCTYYYENNILFDKNDIKNSSYDNMYILSNMLMKITHNHEILMLNKNPSEIDNNLIKINFIKKLIEVNPKIKIDTRNINIKVINSYKGILNANQINKNDIQVFYKKCIIK